MLLVFTTSFLSHDVFPAWPKTELSTAHRLVVHSRLSLRESSVVLRSFAERNATLLDKSMSHFAFLLVWFIDKWNLNRVLEVESHPLEQP